MRHRCNILYIFFIFQCILPASLSYAKQEAVQAVIFMYHRFGESRYPATNVTLKQFEEQLEFVQVGKRLKDQEVSARFP